MSYYQEDVSFANPNAQNTLAGTLTMPQKEGRFPAIILVAGYGPNDRDVTGMGHKYFLAIAEYLTQRGFAVLRYDKRGVGSSTGVYEGATSRDFADDVLAAIAYLKTHESIDSKRIGLIGHSEGGLIASMLCGESNDVAFVVLMAPALINSKAYFMRTSELQMRADGASELFLQPDQQIRQRIYDIVTQQDKTNAEAALQMVLEEYWQMLPERQKEEAAKLPFAFTANKTEMLIKVFNGPWYRFFWTHDVAPALRAINVPVLCMNGTRDWIISSPEVFALLRRNLKSIENSTLIELPNLNHRFQECVTGALAEYAQLKEAISPMALKTMGDWLESHSQ